MLGISLLVINCKILEHQKGHTPYNQGYILRTKGSGRSAKHSLPFEHYALSKHILHLSVFSMSIHSSTSNQVSPSYNYIGTAGAKFEHSAVTTEFYFINYHFKDTNVIPFIPMMQPTVSPSHDNPMANALCQPKLESRPNYTLGFHRHYSTTL